MPIVGAHVSAAGGHFNAVINGTKIGADGIQFFGASPRQWAVKMPTKKDIQAFKDELKKSKIKSVYLHAPYILNLGSSKAASRNRSIALLAKHLEIGELLGAEGTIFHVGSAGADQSMDQALKHSIACLKEVLKRVPGKSFLVIENAAGGGTKIGTTSEQVRTLVKGVGSKRVKVCIDTAHAFEAGLIDYTPKSTKAFFDDWEKAAGKGNIVALHANDSMTKFESRHDRHENIGKGYIGRKGFATLVKDKRVKNIPWFLEVPGFDNSGPDKKNVDILKRIVA